MTNLQPKPVRAWQDSAGVLHADITAWQKAELTALYNRTAITTTNDMDQATLFASLLLTVRDEVLSILTTGPRSRPSTRKRAGTTNPRRATKQQAAARFKAMREAVDHGGTNATRDADVPAEPVGAD